MRVYHYLLADEPQIWRTLIAPGAELNDARRILAHQFGAGRVLDVRPHGSDT